VAHRPGQSLRFLSLPLDGPELPVWYLLGPRPGRLHDRSTGIGQLPGDYPLRSRPQLLHEHTRLSSSRRPARPSRGVTDRQTWQMRAHVSWANRYRKPCALPPLASGIYAGIAPATAGHYWPAPVPDGGVLVFVASRRWLRIVDELRRVRPSRSPSRRAGIPWYLVAHGSTGRALGIDRAGVLGHTSISSLIDVRSLPARHRRGHSYLPHGPPAASRRSRRSG